MPTNKPIGISMVLLNGAVAAVIASSSAALAGGGGGHYGACGNRQTAHHRDYVLHRAHQYGGHQYQRGSSVSTVTCRPKHGCRPTAGTP